MATTVSEGAATQPPQSTAIQGQVVMAQSPAQGREISIPNSNDKVNMSQIFPSPTNNLEIKEFEDPSNKFLFCFELSHTVEYLQYILIVMLILHAICMITVFTEVVSLLSGYYYSITSIVALMSPLATFVGFKLYAFLQCKQFLAKSQVDAVYYHEYGNKLYYAIGSDVAITFLFVFFWVFLAFDESLTEDFIEFENIIWSTITWTLVFPGCVYVVCGCIAILQDLPNFFKQFSYRRYQMTNDIKYCLYYGYSNVHGKMFNKKCLCGCGDSRGGIQGISVWQVIVGVYGAIQSIYFLSWIGESYGAFLGFFYVFVVSCIHLAAAISGFRLISSVVVNFGMNSLAISPGVDSLAFHKRAQQAYFAYSVLSYIYMLAYICFGSVAIAAMLVYISYGSYLGTLAVYFLVITGLGGLISYLPWNGRQMVQALCESVNLGGSNGPQQMIINGQVMQVVTVAQQVIPNAAVCQVPNSNGESEQIVYSK